MLTLVGIPRAQPQQFASEISSVGQNLTPALANRGRISHPRG